MSSSASSFIMCSTAGASGHNLSQPAAQPERSSGVYGSNPIMITSNDPSLHLLHRGSKQQLNVVGNNPATITAPSFHLLVQNSNMDNSPTPASISKHAHANSYCNTANNYGDEAANGIGIRYDHIASLRQTAPPTTFMNSNGTITRTASNSFNCNTPAAVHPHMRSLNSSYYNDHGREQEAAMANYECITVPAPQLPVNPSLGEETQMTSSSQDNHQSRIIDSRIHGNSYISAGTIASSHGAPEIQVIDQQNIEVRHEYMNYLGGFQGGGTGNNSNNSNTNNYGNADGSSCGDGNVSDGHRYHTRDLSLSLSAQKTSAHLQPDEYSGHGKHQSQNDNGLNPPNPHGLTHDRNLVCNPFDSTNASATTLPSFNLHHHNAPLVVSGIFVLELHIDKTQN
jgi:hypothetical protein